MPDRARLAAAGILLALSLAGVPLVLPLDLAKADPVPNLHQTVSTLSPLSLLRTGNLALPYAALQAVADAKAARSHMVAAGETLWGISREAGISVDALAEANSLWPGAILHPGQVLSVPEQDALPSPPPAALAAKRTTHVVASGETLWAISRAAGVRVETLADTNHLALDEILHPGQVLTVPSQDAPIPAVAGRRAVRAGGPAPGVRASVRLGVPEAGLPPLFQPSDGRITSHFGWRIHPIFGTREFHTGIDIANGFGTPVRAARAGVVRYVGWMRGYGRIVILDHEDGLQTSYAHLSSMLVSWGERIAVGQILGRMGSTGWSTGPHLLFEVRRNGVPLDPVRFLQGSGRPSGANAPAAAPSFEHRGSLSNSLLVP